MSVFASIFIFFAIVCFYSALSSVVPQDLIDALETRVENSVSVLPTSTNLTDIVDNWFNEGGFPVVTVELNGSNIVISQVN